jgi:hypothetical protein
MIYIKKFKDMEYNDYSEDINNKIFLIQPFSILIDDGFDIYVQTDIYRE